jgi:hypothetical protein
MSGKVINHPSKMLLIKNDPAYQELWPKALVPYRRIYGIDEPPVLAHRNDGQASPHLPEGTPFGLVGSASLYKRESYPGGVVPAGSVTAVSAKPNDRKQQWRELSAAGGNWKSQGADAGLYDNADIWGIRVLVLEPVSEVLARKGSHFALASDSAERIRILGEFPVRKFVADDKQPLDPDGNPDTSFLAKVPADVAWTFQTLDHNGMVLNMAQTWHQVRPGEVRNNCGGCHAHSQKPTDFKLTLAARSDHQPWDLTAGGATPLFTTKAGDRTGRKWDAADRTGVRTVSGVKDVEYHRDVKPILHRSCVACHSVKYEAPPGHLALDDDRPTAKEVRVPWANSPTVPKGMPETYARLAQRSWVFESRRSPLIWHVYGRRLDGFANEDVPSPAFDYRDEKKVLDWSHHSKHKDFDVDFSGKVMPPPEAVAGTYEGPDGRRVKVKPLSDEDRLTLVRWIDLGCPIDSDFDPQRPTDRGRGWLLDEGRPTLTLALPEPGASAEPLSRILIGMHDYATGLDAASLSVTADFDIDGVKAGENLAAKFTPLPDGRWELRVQSPIASLPSGRLTVSVRDRGGNVSKIERSFSVVR